MKEGVVLIVPNWRWDDSPLAVDTLRPPPCPPLEFAYIASGLDQHPVVLDAFVEDLTVDDLSARIEAIKPASIVVTTTPSLLYWRCPPLSIVAPRHAITAARSHGARTIAIGPHPTFSPAWFVEATGVDIAFRGSPERCLTRVPSHKSQLLGPALWGARTQSSIAVEHAADLPCADFSIFDFDLPYEPHMWGVSKEEREIAGHFARCSLIEFSRGCPWSCSYCAKVPVRDKFERRPLGRVLEELQALEAAGVDYVFFIDETFNLPGNEFDELLNALSALSLSYGFQGRPDLITPRLAERLAKSGCVYAELGIDVALNDVSNEIGRKQKMSSAQLGISLLSELVPIVRFNRLNLQTLDYRERLGYPYQQGWSYPPDPTFPYPGSPLGDEWSKWYGSDTGEFDWESAERYGWWLRLEVMMQRSGHCPPDGELRVLMNKFLNMEPAHQREVASRFNNVSAPIEFQRENLSVLGNGRE